LRIPIVRLLLRVKESVPGLGELLEILFGFRVVGVSIRMAVFRLAAECLADFFFGSAWLYAEYFMWVKQIILPVLLR